MAFRWGSVDCDRSDDLAHFNISLSTLSRWRAIGAISDGRSFVQGHDQFTRKMEALLLNRAGRQFRLPGIVVHERQWRTCHLLTAKVIKRYMAISELSVREYLISLPPHSVRDLFREWCRLDLDLVMLSFEGLGNPGSLSAPVKVSQQCCPESFNPWISKSLTLKSRLTIGNDGPRSRSLLSFLPSTRAIEWFKGKSTLINRWCKCAILNSGHTRSGKSWELTRKLTWWSVCEISWNVTKSRKWPLIMIVVVAIPS
jgi:hypothetical protein